MKHVDNQTIAAWAATVVAAAVVAVALIVFSGFAPSVGAWSAGIFATVAVAIGRTSPRAGGRARRLSS